VPAEGRSRKAVIRIAESWRIPVESKDSVEV